MASHVRDYRTPLARVRHLGAAKDGTHHWWHQRVTSIALVPLAIWFVISLIPLVGASYSEAAAWAGHPVVAALLILLLVAMFYHMALGLQVVVEDYVHHEGAKIATLLAIKFVSAIGAVAGILAVLTVALG